MLKGQGPSGKSPAKQKVEAAASLSEALERSNTLQTREKTMYVHSGPLDGECHHDERFTIYIEVEKNLGACNCVSGQSGPCLCLDHRDHQRSSCERYPGNNTTCVIEPQSLSSLQRMAIGWGEDAIEIVGRTGLPRVWAGEDGIITAYAMTLGEACHTLVKASDFIRKQRLQKLTAPKPMPMPAAVHKKPSQPVTSKEPMPIHIFIRDRLWQWSLWVCTGTSQLSDVSPYDATDLKEEFDDIVEYDTENSHWSDDCHWQESGTMLWMKWAPMPQGAAG